MSVPSCSGVYSRISRMMCSRWLRPFLGVGRDELLHGVAEEQGAYLVVVEHHGESQGGGDFRHQFPLGLPRGAEQAGPADVDQEDHRELALFLEDLHVRRAHAGRDVPVHVPHVVAVLVLADLAERHAAALEGRMVFTGEDLVRESLRLDLDLADALEELLGCHTLTGR